jgi:hypothetical protein
MNEVMNVPAVALPIMPDPLAALGADAAPSIAMPFPKVFEVPKFSPESENLPLAATVATAGKPPRGVKGANKPTRLEEKIGEDVLAFFEGMQAAIKADAAAVVSLGRQGDDAIYAFLERSHDFVRDDLFTEDKFVVFCRARKLSCTKATRKNLFLCAIRAIAPEIDAKIASKYAAALLWVDRIMPVGGSVSEVLRANRGVEGCAKLARREKRALAGRPAVEPVRRLSVIGVPEGLDGTVAMIVAIEHGKARFVGRADESPQSLAHPGAGAGGDEIIAPDPAVEGPGGGTGDQVCASIGAEGVLHQN